MHAQRDYMLYGFNLCGRFVDDGRYQRRACKRNLLAALGVASPAGGHTYVIISVVNFWRS
jgi:hypothetical protein